MTLSGDLTPTNRPSQPSQVATTSSISLSRCGCASWASARYSWRPNFFGCSMGLNRAAAMLFLRRHSSFPPRLSVKYKRSYSTWYSCTRWTWRYLRRLTLASRSRDGRLLLTSFSSSRSSWILCVHVAAALLIIVPERRRARSSTEQETCPWHLEGTPMFSALPHFPYP
ncbi:unnamed protein product, partial [Ectocarpus sp. 8 AP-2014]